jgi:predicted Zn finger-like uncharacterized protein
MIIECLNCHSRFRLDDARIGKGETRLRCSVCKHTFVFSLPAAAPGAVPAPQETGSPASAIDRPAAPAARSAAPPQASPAAAIPPARERQNAGRLADLFEDLPDVSEGVAGGAESPPLMEDKPQGFAGRSARSSVPYNPLGFEKAAALTRRPSSWARFLWGLVILVLLLGALFAAVWMWVPGYLPESLRFPAMAGKTSARTAETRLILQGVSGSFIPSQKFGPIFVVRGEVRNEYPENRSFLQLRGTILDEKGEKVASRESYAGNLPGNEVLAGLAPEQVEGLLQNRSGTEVSNVGVTPGKAVPFLIVFHGLPESISEFTVEAVGSSPTT